MRVLSLLSPQNQILKNELPTFKHQDFALKTKSGFLASLGKQNPLPPGREHTPRAKSSEQMAGRPLLRGHLSPPTTALLPCPVSVSPALGPCSHRPLPLLTGNGLAPPVLEVTSSTAPIKPRPPPLQLLRELAPPAVTTDHLVIGFLPSPRSWNCREQNKSLHTPACPAALHRSAHHSSQGLLPQIQGFPDSVLF